MGSWEWDPDWDQFVLSDEMCRLLGIEAGEATGRGQDFWSRLHPDDVESTRATLLRASQNAGVFVHEHRVLRPDGSERMLQSRGQPLASGPGQGRRLVGTCWDITELWEGPSWPERSASLLRATLDATADGILVVDCKGRVVTYNQRFLELWQIPVEVAARSENLSLVRYVQDQLVDPENFARAAYQNVLHPDREYFMVLRFKDGRVFERFSRPQRVGDEIIGRVLTFRDVTEREQLLERAQDAVRLRDEFLSIAAHEIRGPITSMRLAVQSLRAGTLPPEVLPQSLDIIDRSQRRLSDFVEKLLDLGRIQTGLLQLEFEPLDLREVIREAVSRYELELARSGSTLALRADAPVPGHWDRVRLDQLASNLLSNAIKFGAGKPIQVEVSERDGRGLLVVSDQGIGIPREIQCRIFQPFQRGVSIRHYGGLGLGLHIVQTIVAGFRGTVTVESEPGAGATFRVELPVEKR